MSTQPAAVASVEHEGFTVTGNTSGSPEALTESLKVGDPQEPEKEPDLSKAGSDLGKKGGEAAAKARKEALKAKPIPDKPAEAKAAPAPEAQPEEKPDETPEPAEAKAQRSRAEERVREATRAAAEARREAAELRSRLDRIEHERTQPAAPAGERMAQPEQPAEDAEPKEEDFEDYREFVKATARYEYKQAAREEQRKQYAHAVASAHAQRIGTQVSAFKAAWQGAVEADPEFPERLSDDVKNLIPSITLPRGSQTSGANWIADDLMSSPSANLMLYLSEHPEEFQRIAALQSPREVTRELAKIEARSDATAGTPPDVSRPAPKPGMSKALPPPTPVRGAPPIAGASDPAPRQGESFDEWLKRTAGNTRKR